MIRPWAGTPRGGDRADDALADADAGGLVDPEEALAGAFAELVGVVHVDEHDDAGLGSGGDHRGVEDDLEDAVEVEGGGEGLAEAPELAAHLVAGGGEGLHVRLGLGGHAVERERELGHLVAPVDGHAHVEVAFADAFGGGRELGERAGGGAGEPGGEADRAHGRGGDHGGEGPVHGGDVGGDGADAQREEGVGEVPAPGFGAADLEGGRAGVLEDDVGVRDAGEAAEELAVDGAEGAEDGGGAVRVLDFGLGAERHDRGRSGVGDGLAAVDPGAFGGLRADVGARVLADRGEAGEDDAVDHGAVDEELGHLDRVGLVAATVVERHGRRGGLDAFADGAEGGVDHRHRGVREGVAAGVRQVGHDGSDEDGPDQNRPEHDDEERRGEP